MDFSLEFHTGCFGDTLGGLYLQSYILFHSLMIDFVLAKVQTLMKCRLMRHFIWSFTVCHIYKSSKGQQCCTFTGIVELSRGSFRNTNDSNATDSRLVGRISCCLLFYSALFNLLSIPLPGSFSLITLAFHHANAASTRQIINSFHLQANNVRIL